MVDMEARTPTPTHIDLERAALAMLRGRAHFQRADAILELIRFQGVPLTSEEVDLLNALLQLGQKARNPEVF